MTVVLLFKIVSLHLPYCLLLNKLEESYPAKILFTGALSQDVIEKRFYINKYSYH